MRTVTIKYWAPFLHKELSVGDELRLLYTRTNNYGQPLYIFESKVGNQYLHKYELDIITLNRESTVSAFDEQTGGDHYKKLKIQPMQYALANNLNYAQANAIKYITRYKDKNGIEDLKKAIHCLELLMEYENEVCKG